MVEGALLPMQQVIMIVRNLLAQLSAIERIPDPRTNRRLNAPQEISRRSKLPYLVRQSLPIERSYVQNQEDENRQIGCRRRHRKQLVRGSEDL